MADLFWVDVPLLQRLTRHLPGTIGPTQLESGADEILARQICEASNLSLHQARRLVIGWNLASADVRKLARWLNPPPPMSEAMRDLARKMASIMRDTARTLRAGGNPSLVAYALEVGAEDLEKDL